MVDKVFGYHPKRNANRMTLRKQGNPDRPADALKNRSGKAHRDGHAPARLGIASGYNATPTNAETPAYMNDENFLEIISHNPLTANVEFCRFTPR